MENSNGSSPLQDATTTASHVGVMHSPGKLNLKFVLLIAAIFIFVAGSYLTITNVQSPEEKQAVADAQTLKSMMKDPSSFTIHGDIWVRPSSGENADENHKFTFIDSTATNSFNAPVRSVAIFENGKYLGDYNDNPSSSANSDSFTLGSFIYASAQYEAASDGKPAKLAIVSGKKVAKLIGAQYSD